MQQIPPFYLPTETVTILVEFFFLQLFAVPTGWEESHKFKRFRRAQEELVSSNISLSNPSSWLTVRKNMGRGPVAGRWKTHFAPRGPLRRTGPLKPTRNVIWQPCDLAAEIFFFSSFFDKDLKKKNKNVPQLADSTADHKRRKCFEFFSKDYFIQQDSRWLRLTIYFQVAEFWRPDRCSPSTGSFHKPQRRDWIHHLPVCTATL